MADIGDLLSWLLGQPTRGERYRQWAEEQERQGFIPDVPVMRHDLDGTQRSADEIEKGRRWAERKQAAERTMPLVKENRGPIASSGGVYFPPSVPGTYDRMPEMPTQLLDDVGSVKPHIAAKGRSSILQRLMEGQK